MGSIGAVRSRAWIWDFSSTHSTTAFCGGARYRPTTSVTLATSSGSVENLNVSERHGWMPNSRHARVTVASPSLSLRASNRLDQWVTPRDFGGGLSVADTIAAGSTVRGRPDRGASASPPIPLRSYRARQAITVCRVIPTRRPISAFGRPSAASSTIRARATSPAGAVEDRVSARSRAPSPSRNASGAATAMPHSPAPPHRQITSGAQH
jgi:hypothetical protein